MPLPLPAAASPDRSIWVLHVEPVDRLGAPGEGLQRGRQPEVVQGSRAELGDQVAQSVDLMPESLEGGVDGGPEGARILVVAGVGQLQAQGADALDALVVDLPRPACALVLSRLHAVAQAFDLDRPLGREPLGDAGGEGLQGVPVGFLERSLGAERDHQAAAVALELQRLDEHRAGFDPQFVEPGSVVAPGAVECERAALGVDRSERAAAAGDDPQARAGGAAGGGHAQLLALLDHDDQAVGVEQRQPAVGHQPQQPQL